MERDRSFTSTSILGSIYDEVRRWQTTDMSGNEIRKFPCFDVEIPMHCMKKWEALYKAYRKDMSIACSDATKSKGEEAAQVIKIYKQKFDDDANIEDRSKNIQVKDVARCGFVWQEMLSSPWDAAKHMESAAALAKELSNWREVGDFYQKASQLYMECSRPQPASDALAKGAR